MRTIYKMITLPVEGKPMEIRIGKMDAFSGAKLLKMLSRERTEDLQEMVMGLPDEDMEALMRVCLKHAAAMLPAGPIAILENGCWGIPSLEYDAWTCLKITMEVMAWTMTGFFPESGSET